MNVTQQSDQYPIFEVPISELHASDSEPAHRTEYSSAFTTLRNSIREVGLQYPPLVVRRKEGDGYTVVDGHRRIACLKDLAWQKVPVLVSEGTPDKLFTAVCGTTKPVTATQWIDVFLKGGEIPSGPTKVNINKLNETVGKEFLRELVENKLSPQIWSLANRAMRYAEIPEERKPDVLRWILKFKITRQVAAFISGGSTAAKLRHAFEANASI